MIWCDQWWHPVVMCRSWCLLLHPAHLAPASPSLHLIRYDKLNRASTCKTITGDWSNPSHPSPSSCWTLAIKGDDVCFFAHLSSPLNCKHITLKTGLESQQMSNWRVNYHHAPLMSLSAALWLLSDGAFFFSAIFEAPHTHWRDRQTIISNRLLIFEHLQKKTTLPLVIKMIPPVCLGVTEQVITSHPSTSAPADLTCTPLCAGSSL